MNRIHIFGTVATLIMTASGDTPAQRWAWVAIGALVMWAFTQLLIAERIAERSKYVVSMMKHHIIHSGAQPTHAHTPTADQEQTDRSPTPE